MIQKYNEELYELAQKQRNKSMDTDMYQMPDVYEDEEGKINK